MTDKRNPSFFFFWSKLQKPSPHPLLFKATAVLPSAHAHRLKLSALYVEAMLIFPPWVVPQKECLNLAVQLLFPAFFSFVFAGGQFKKEVVVDGQSHLLLIREEAGPPDAKVKLPHGPGVCLTSKCTLHWYYWFNSYSSFSRSL